MDFQFLPEKVRKLLEAKGASGAAITIFRTGGSLDGSPGEGYVAAYNDGAFFISRKMGESEYICRSGKYKGEMTDMDLESEKFNSILKFKLAGTEYEIKLSPFDEKNIHPMLERWRQINSCSGEATTEIPQPDEPNPTPQTQYSTSTNRISPLAALAAALMYVAGADNELDATEEAYIRRVCEDKRDELRTGMDYYHKNSFDRFLDAVRNLTKPQHLCIFANMTDLAMADGVIHASERQIINAFALAVGISDKTSQTIHEVLIVKNRTAVLCE